VKQDTVQKKFLLFCEIHISIIGHKNVNFQYMYLLMIRSWLKSRISHKIEHLSWKNTKLLLHRHGPAFVTIIVVWEIIEDVLFPLLFGLLGKYIHPIFYGGIPMSWLLCLHWLAVPLLWGLWLRLNGNEIVRDHERKYDCDHDH
jgi:hypothetical protein